MKKSITVGMPLQIFLLLVFTCSCTKIPLFSKHSGWIFAETRTGVPCFNSGKIFLSTKASSCPMELEISRGRSGIRVYLNLLIYCVSPCQDDPSLTELTLVWTSGCHVIRAFVFEGGQRILLPEHIGLDLIQALWNQETVTLQSGQLQGSFPPVGFRQAYDSLVQIPIF